MRVLRYQPRIVQMVMRLVADMVMGNLALVAVLAARYLWLVGAEGYPSDARALFANFIHFYVATFWILTCILAVTFWASGFYSHGRAYRGRYKVLMILQAVTVSYLAFGFASYFVGGPLHLPRSIFPVAWAVTAAMLIGARFLVDTWEAIARVEWNLTPATARKIEHVLVIGGDGYIGSALLPKLLAKGYRVRVLSLFLYGTEPIADLLANPRLEIMQADFRQVDKLVEAMRGVDAVVHLGAIVGDPACALDEDLTIDVNLAATRTIAEVAKGHGINRFIFASTCSVYGASDHILDERSELNPVSLYAKTKIACERVLAKLADDTFAPISLRFGTIYGLSGRTRFDLVVNLLTAQAICDGEITVMGGDQWRPFVHVDDAAQAVLAAVEAPLNIVRNGVFNVGSDEQNYTINDVGRLVQRLVPTARLLSLDGAGDPRNYRVNFTSARATLGFKPRWTLERGVLQIIDALQSGRITDYRAAKYSNVKFLHEEGMGLLRRRDTTWARDLIQEWTVPEVVPQLGGNQSAATISVIPGPQKELDGNHEIGVVPISVE